MKTGEYKVLRKQVISFEDYELKPISFDDREPIRKWRNDQVDVLRQKSTLSADNQRAYFQNVILKLFEKDYPEQLIFSFFKNEELIGYGGLVHISWEDKRGEVSFLLETTRNNDLPLFQTEYAIFLNLIKQIAFQDLAFNKITTEAFDLRDYVIETLESNGFVLEGRLKHHNFINGKWYDSLLHSCFNA